jgi:hypothetical protein
MEKYVTFEECKYHFNFDNKCSTQNKLLCLLTFPEKRVANILTWILYWDCLDMATCKLYHVTWP